MRTGNCESASRSASTTRGETLWNNGIKQNAVFLAEALKHCDNVGSVVLVNITQTPITDRMPWDLALAGGELRGREGHGRRAGRTR